MFSLCRTTSLLVSKESDDRISYKSREKEDSLSLKMGDQTFCISFSFLPLHVFLSFVLFLPFCFFFLFHFSSHLSFTFSSFSLLLCHSLPFWMSIDRMGQKEAISSSFPQVSCVAINFPSFFFFFSLFPFYDIINHMAQYGHGIKFHTWLIVSHGIHDTHVALCEPILFMPTATLLRCHVASPYLAMCHPTPHASKNVKSQPFRKSTKFDVVAKFRETISTEESVSSSEI